LQTKSKSVILALGEAITTHLRPLFENAAAILDAIYLAGKLFK